MEVLFPYNCFPNNILAKAPTYETSSVSKEYDLECYINFTSPLKHYFFSNGQKCMLNKDGRLYYEHLILQSQQAKEKKEKENAKENLVIQNLELTVKKLQREVDDYKSIKRQRNVAYAISIILFIIAVISFFKS